MIILLFAYLTIVNQQLTIKSITILLSGILLMILFINYLNNLSKTRYFEIYLNGKLLKYYCNKTTVEISTETIRKMIFLTQKDISGTTKYVIILRKGKFRPFILSNYRSKETKLDLLITDEQLKNIKITNVKNNILSQFVSYFYLTFM